MTYFVFSDIHGALKELQEALNEKGFDETNDNHVLLFLGDAFDKGREDGETYLFLKSMMKKHKLIWIRGNHETYMLNRLEKGGAAKFTKDSVRKIAKAINPDIDTEDDGLCVQTLIDDGMVDLIKNKCIDYYETPNYVFTHAFIPYNKRELTYDQEWRTRNNWNAYRTVNAIKMVELYNIKVPSKTLVSGHVGAFYGRIFEMTKDISLLDSLTFDSMGQKLRDDYENHPELFKTYEGNGVIGLDGNVYKTGVMNLIVIED